MPINFPDSPSNNETFISGDNTWQWDGTAWNIVSAVTPLNYIISASEPSSPLEGQTWFDSSESRLYLYYNSEWVETPTSGLLPVVSVASDVTLEANTRYFVDSSAARTLTLPASPSLGDELVVYDAGGASGTNNITLLRNGTLINATTENAIIDVDQSISIFVYTGTTVGWRFE